MKRMKNYICMYTYMHTERMKQKTDFSNIIHTHLYIYADRQTVRQTDIYIFTHRMAREKLQKTGSE